MYRDFDPDLVILDVMMPGMNGYDVCREIRTGDLVTPVIMLTAKGREVDKVVGLELGADDYMVKPFGMDGKGGQGFAPPCAGVRCPGRPAAGMPDISPSGMSGSTLTA